MGSSSHMVVWPCMSYTAKADPARPWLGRLVGMVQGTPSRAQPSEFFWRADCSMDSCTDPNRVWSYPWTQANNKNACRSDPGPRCSPNMHIPVRSQLLHSATYVVFRLAYCLASSRPLLDGLNPCLQPKPQPTFINAMPRPAMISVPMERHLIKDSMQHNGRVKSQGVVIVL